MARFRVGLFLLVLCVTATASFAISDSTVTPTGTSGPLQHTTSLSLTRNGLAGNGPSGRTRYHRTDTTTEYPLFSNQHWILYHAATARYFMTDPSSNQVQVIDATTEERIATIPVPGAFGIDDTPDHNTLWVGTLIGDVYSLDPASMTVTHRYLGSKIGPSGYLTQSVQVLADGRLALVPPFTGLGGISSVAVWNPVDNALSAFALFQGRCGYEIKQGFSRTVDRTRILLGGEEGSLCALDPSTGDYITSAAQMAGAAAYPTPDGRHIIISSLDHNGSAVVLDAHTLATISEFPILGEVGDSDDFVISADSRTLYTPGLYAVVYAYSLPNGQPLGWTPNLYLYPLSGGLAFGPINGPDLQATDGSGLFAGPMEQGIGFVDLSALNTGPVGTLFVEASLSPATGPTTGGTATQWRSSVNGPISAVYFGQQRATRVSYDQLSIYATSPAGSPGSVDVFTLTADHGMQLIPEGFNYGPTILEVTPNISPAEGGGTGYIYGYGFGPINSTTIPSDLRVKVNGTPVTVTAFSGNAYNAGDPPFPLESVAYTIPSGGVGSSANVTVTTSGGSATASAALTYLPSIRQFPLPGAALAQGIYDPHNDLYYFTDATQVRVFSRTHGQFLSSITFPPPLGTQQRLWGIALSPDGSKMAVSDSTAGVIYVFNPANPAEVQTFIVGSSGSLIINPCGLAISDSGNIYYWVFIDGGTGHDQFFKLNTNTGAIYDYRIDGPGSPRGDVYLRDVISSDNSRVFAGFDGVLLAVDTATDQIIAAPGGPFGGCCYGNYELSLSSNQTQVTATNYIYDNLLNGESTLALNDRENLNVSYVYGAKLNYDSRLLFQPSSNGIDVFDGHLGNLRARIALPFALTSNYDALAVDPTDNVLIAITGNSGDGIAVVDLRSLPEPSLIPTTTTLTSAPNPSSLGQSVTMTATVLAHDSSTPVGMVAFKNNGVGIGTVSLSSGIAVLNYTGLPLGTDSLTAVYQGSTTLAPSTSNTVTQTVNLPASVTTVTSAPNPSIVGEAVTITATVGPAGPPAPSGTVAFTSNGNSIAGCTAVPLDSAMAQCMTSGLPTGTNALVATYSGDSNYAGSNGTLTQFVNPVPNPLQFVALPSCRVVDTRPGQGINNPIQGGTSQSFVIPGAGSPPCPGIPSDAAAFSLNVTVVPHRPLSYLTIWPTGEAQPTVSLLNSSDGRVKANAAIVPAGTNGAVSVYVTDTSDVILDIDGYFTAPAAQTLQFYPVTPCRVVDTRDFSQPQGLGPPSLQDMEVRRLPILTTSCVGLPSDPQAYSFNVTVVPTHNPLNYLTVWPSDQQQPVVSTLNNPTATAVANAAIVPAAANGDISVFAYNSTDVIMDINGYFAAPGQGGYSFYAVAPCRVYDSRLGGGQPFNGPRTVDVAGSPCAPPATAAAYVFNATVVPSGSLGYLTVWPHGQQQEPVVSTLNAYDGFITSNMAIVPNLDGSTNTDAAYGYTHLILDISGYFAP